MTDDTWTDRATSFGNAAADYATGRPHYPREALEWGLPAGSRTVLDLAAGTGILTQDLLDLGLDVVSVEPLSEMRELISSTARVLDGSAESIPLDANAVDAVFVGQAWHWFDAPRALAEAHRVLRPGGALVLLWNLIDASDSTSRKIAETIDDPVLNHLDDSPAPLDWPDHFSTPERTLLPHVQGYDAARITSYTVSRSNAILLDATNRDELVARLLAVVPPDAFPVNWLCEAWRATAL